MPQFWPTQPPPPSDTYAQGLNRLMDRLDCLEARLADPDHRAFASEHPPHSAPDYDLDFDADEEGYDRRDSYTRSWQPQCTAALDFNPSRVPDTGLWRGAFVGHHRRTYGRPPPHVTREDQRLRQRQPPQLSSWDRPVSHHYSDVEDTDVWQQRTSWDPHHHRRHSEPATCWNLPTANFQYEHSDFPRQQPVGTRFPMMFDQGGRRSRTDEVDLPRSNYRSRIAECRPQQPSSWDSPAVRYATDVKAKLLDAETGLPVAEADLRDEADPHAVTVELPVAEIELLDAEAEHPVAEAERYDATEPPAELKAELHAEDTEGAVEIVAEVFTRADQPRIVAEVLPRGLNVEPYTFVSSAPVVLQKPPFIVHAGCGVGGRSKFQPSRALVACKNESNYQSQSDWVGSMASIWFHVLISRRVFDPGGDISPPSPLCSSSSRSSWVVATWYPP